jgi:single-strand DNA-binding protein
MSSVNKVILIGNIGRIESKQTQVGFVSNFSIATSSKYKDRAGILVETTEWHNCVAFGKLSEIMAQYTTKGSKVYIEGNLKTEKYDKNGTTMYTTKIIAQNLQMLDSKKDRVSDNASIPTMAGAQPYDFGDSLPGDDTLPF